MIQESNFQIEILTNMTETGIVNFTYHLETLYSTNIGVIHA